jgi:hypothetical protein
MAGLPGTGLGGIFYALLVIWMAMRETWLVAQGASSPARWERIAWFAVLLMGIVAALWIEGWLLQHLLGPLPGTAGAAQTISRAGVAVGALVPALAVSPFVILAALIIAMHAARLVMRGRAASPKRQHELPALEIDRAVALDIRRDMTPAVGKGASGASVPHRN